MTTVTITAFLLARIAEDEAAARAGVEAENGFGGDYFGDTATEAALGLAESEGADRRIVQHLARHDPARVLTECAAKRAIVDAYEAWDESTESFSPDYWAAPMSAVVEALAAVHADHPDYDRSWR